MEVRGARHGVTEVHTAQPIGTKYVVFIQNGDPALLRVVEIATNQTVREFPLPTGNPKSVHGHFRHARLTPAGTILVAHMDNKKVSEYDSTGKEVWSYAIESPWSASRLPNGNTLIATNKKLVVEVDPKGQTVWELKPADMPGYKIDGFQIAQRLPNGNTLVNNWVNQWNTTVDPANTPVQALGIHSHQEPGMGATFLDRSRRPRPGDDAARLLDTRGVPEDVHFGDIQVTMHHTTSLDAVTCEVAFPGGQ